MNLIFVCSVSTLLFNGNPLLRFDGYYVFSDLLEMPNLRQRATQYYDAGDYARAEQQARQGLAIDPDHGLLNLILGRAMLGRRLALRSAALTFQSRSFRKCRGHFKVSSANGA